MQFSEHNGSSNGFVEDNEISVENEEVAAFRDENNHGISTNRVSSHVNPFEVERGGNEDGNNTDDDNDDEEVGNIRVIGEHTRDPRLFSWKDPWIVTSISSWLVASTLFAAVYMLYELIGKVWVGTLFALHAFIMLWVAFSNIPDAPQQSLCLRIAALGLDFILIWFLYNPVWSGVIEILLRDIDGTIVVEYTSTYNLICWIQWSSQLAITIRAVLEALGFAATFVCRYTSTDITQHPLLPIILRSCMARMEFEPDIFTFSRKLWLKNLLKWIFGIALALSGWLLLWSLWSCLIHFGHWPPPTSHDCDPLDLTECMLPFPSSHHLVTDATTKTGYRVDLKGLPKLKGGVTIDASFVNRLDGFSTMAPILFYLPGLKEAKGGGAIGWNGDLLYTASPMSVTYLIDLETKHTVAHAIDVDYLDPERPLLMMFPTMPLKHNTHYLVATRGLKDKDGYTIPPTQGMQDLWNSDNERKKRYEQEYLPALAQATRSRTPVDPQTIQIMFDFHTISEESQLGDVRTVRDTTLHILTSRDWDWKKHAQLIRHEDFNCNKEDVHIARTLHIELEVPWFLDSVGTNRAAVLDLGHKPQRFGRAKFVTHIPCSLKSAALDKVEGNPQKLKAVMEFGHGLFFNRGESRDDFLVKMADDNGYILTAMDWRGMSSFDLLVVVKTLVAEPNSFQSIRDNLIQGYANKYAMQHFTQNGMLDLSWFKFRKIGYNAPLKIPWREGTKKPTSVFYGISQGGILGAGYSALSGPSGLIDRAVLGVPGTPFALIMSRSLAFSDYDKLMLLNFYNNRHIRLFLNLAQMLWDSVEASGVLAPPVTEAFPRTLIQAGLGDPVVTSLAAECLGRAYGGNVLPRNPRRGIFGLEKGDPADGDSLGPKVTVTELNYDKEASSLPTTDEFAQANDVHVCVRRDVALIGQIEEFVNTGRIIDPCMPDNCHRDTADCFTGNSEGRRRASQNPARRLGRLVGLSRY